MIKDKLEQKLKEIKSVALKVIEEASSSEELYQVKVRFFGKQGEFTALMKQLGQFSKEERPQVGQLINQEKKALEEVENGGNKEEHLKAKRAAKKAVYYAKKAANLSAMFEEGGW